jgi:hypothetical protein
VEGWRMVVLAFGRGVVKVRYRVVILVVADGPV